MEGSVVWVFIALVVIMFVGGIFANIALKKRVEALSALAARLGLAFSEDEDLNLPGRFDFLEHLANGTNRYAFNVLSGNYQNHVVLAFDYHYETHSRGKNGRRETHHHYFSFFILMLTAYFPELRITSEGFFSKIAQAAGYDDIDFELAEFSKAFCVRSKSRKFAYDACNPRMMEYLLANRDLSIEIDDSALALAFNRRLSAADVELNLQRLIEVRSRLPDYLFVR